MEVQHAIIVEKVQDVMQRSVDNKSVVVAHEQQKENEHRTKTVNEVEKDEGMTELNEDTSKRKEEEKKRKERQKQIARQLVRDTGHIIDLEA